MRTTLRRLSALVATMLGLSAAYFVFAEISPAGGPACGRFCSGQESCNATCPDGCSPARDGPVFDCCCTLQLTGDPTRYCCSGQCWRAKCIDRHRNPCPRPIERFVCGQGALVSGYHRCENNYCVGPAPWPIEDPVPQP
jgi:hypothetical protein